MALRRLCALLVCLTVPIFSQTAKQTAVPIVQPGAPGKPTKKLAYAALPKQKQSPTQADVSFMQGMIHHHAQAVEMVDLLRTRGLSKDLLAFGERITISQSDEIEFMKTWLTDYGKPAAPAHDHAAHITAAAPGEHKQASMHTMPLMPGMLTAEQMTALARAKGREFDRLFLTGMIQHHEGALVMVDELFDTPGAGQESALYDFAVDIDNTQAAEIRIMGAMLKEMR